MTPFNQANCGCCWACGSTAALSDRCAAAEFLNSGNSMDDLGDNDTSSKFAANNPQLSPLTILRGCSSDTSHSDGVDPYKGANSVLGCCGSTTSSSGLSCLVQLGAGSAPPEEFDAAVSTEPCTSDCPQTDDDVKDIATMKRTARKRRVLLFC